MYIGTLPLEVPGPLVGLVRVAASLPFIGSLVCHHYVVLEIENGQAASEGRQHQASSAGGQDSDSDRGCTFVLCDFEPLDKTSGKVTIKLLAGGEVPGRLRQRWLTSLPRASLLQGSGANPPSPQCTQAPRLTAKDCKSKWDRRACKLPHLTCACRDASVC